MAKKGINTSITEFNNSLVRLINSSNVPPAAILSCLRCAELQLETVNQKYIRAESEAYEKEMVEEKKKESQEVAGNGKC